MNVRIASTLALILALALAPVAGAQTQQTGDQAPPDDLDQTLIEVKSEAARKLLGRDTIPVRRRVTHYMPSGEVPIPRLAPVSVEDVGAALAQAIARHSGEQGGKVRQRRQGPFLVAEAGSHRYWASLASGAYKLTDIEASSRRKPGSAASTTHCRPRSTMSPSRASWRSARTRCSTSSSSPP
jgi:hypothetical protein